jgi:UDP-N-acetylmuramate dehydrogenase
VSAPVATKPASEGTTAGLARAVAERLGPSATLDAPLGALTTYRVGGRAAVLVDAGSEDDLLVLQRVLGDLRASASLPVLVVGKGSNMLVADAGFPGLVVRLGGRLADITVPDRPGLAAPPGGKAEDGGDAPVTVRAGGAAGLPVLARRSVKEGLTGLEWAVGIPGTVGGALKMNAGGHGSDTASCLARFRMVDLTGEGAVEDGPERLRLGYRSSALSAADVVVWADFVARPGDPAVGEATVSEIVRWRRQHQPGGSNAGSVFTNPPGDSAGRLVEVSRLKGFRLRSARVSEKHANFIQADDGGSADDVCALMAHVRTTVAEATGVWLNPEVKLVGFPEGTLGDGPGAGTQRPVVVKGEGE